MLGCGDATCSDDDIVELANGCLCCTVADDFLPTLTRLIERAEPPEPYRRRDLGPRAAEAAGAGVRLARDPHPHDGGRCRTVIDAAAVAAGRFADDPEAVAAQRGADPAIDHDNPLEEVFADQLACADLVILNKTDLLDPLASSRCGADIEGSCGRV